MMYDLSETAVPGGMDVAPAMGSINGLTSMKRSALTSAAKALQLGLATHSGARHWAGTVPRLTGG